MSAPLADAGEAPVLSFSPPPAGLPGLERAHLVALDELGALFELRPADDDDGTRLLVVAPGPFFPDYAPEVDDETAEALELRSADDALVLLVVNPGATPADATANLLAPVVVNRTTRRAAQVVLADAALPLRAPLAS